MKPTDLPRLARAPLARCAALLLAALVPLSPAAAQKGRDPAPASAEKLLRSTDFRLIGPANTSGRITSLAVPEAQHGRVIYAGTAGGGVWRTTNLGTTWQPLWDDQPFASIGDVAVAPSDSQVVWVGTGERNSLRSQGWGDGVYRSTDGGSSWTHVGLAETREIGRIVVHPTDASVAYVAALGHLWGAGRDRGVYRTTDGGKSWKQVLFVDDTTGIVDLKMDPRDPQVLYAAAWHRIRWGGGHMEGAGQGSGIYKTTDGGDRWTRLTDPRLANGLPSRDLGRIGLAVYPKDPRIVYAVVQAAHGNREQTVSPAGGVFRSDDAGAHWSRVNDVSAVPDYYYNEIYVDPTDPDRVWLNGTFLMLSKDGGRSFSRFDLGNVHVDHHALWIDPAEPRTMVLGNDGGVHLTFDGGENWRHENLPVGQFYEIALDTTKTPYHVCGGLQDNGVWCGPSRTRERAGITDRDWYAVYGGDGFGSAVSPDDPNIRYAEYQFASIARWNVATGEYTDIRPEAEDAGPESGYEFRFDWNAPFILSQFDPTVLYLGGNHLFKLTQRGDDWQILGPDMTRQSRTGPEAMPAHTSYGALHSIAESPLDRDVLWTGSDDGLIWTTRDGGRSWARVSDHLRDKAPQRCWVSEIQASHFDARRAYVAFDCHMRDDYHPYVYRTDDGGAHWTSLAGDLPADGGSYVVREDPVNPSLVFAGTEQGLFASLHGGGQWVRMRGGLPTAAVRDLDVALSQHELVVGTMGRSVYIADVSALQQLTPETLARPAALLQIQPARQFEAIDSYESFGDAFFTAKNPAYGATISYYLKADQGKEVKLSIRRAGSDEVIRTLDGSGEAGLHRVTWELKSEKPRPRELGGPTSADELKRVLPGEYTVELKVGDETLRQPLVVETGWVEKEPGRVR